MIVFLIGFSSRALRCAFRCSFADAGLQRLSGRERAPVLQSYEANAGGSTLFAANFAVRMSRGERKPKTFVTCSSGTALDREAIDGELPDGFVARWGSAQ
jgi:hypothetical protein